MLQEERVCEEPAGDHFGPWDTNPVDDDASHPLRCADRRQSPGAPARVVGGVGEDGRVDRAGQDGADPYAANPGQPQFLSQAAAEAADRELGHRVRRAVGQRDDPEQRGDVDHHAAALVDHPGQRGPAPVHVSHQVHVQHPSQVLERNLDEGPEHHHRGRVHPGVDPAEPLDGSGRYRIHRIRVADVGGGGQRLRPRGGAFGRGLVERVGVPGDQHHPRAPGGQRPRRGPSDAAGGAGHHRDAASDPHALPVPAVPRGNRFPDDRVLRSV